MVKQDLLLDSGLPVMLNLNVNGKADTFPKGGSATAFPVC